MRRAAVGLVCALLLSSGCIHRSLTIQTTPPGAAVFVNDQLKGESPVTYDFNWYGWYRVRIEKEGYEQLHDHHQLRAPIHLWIPFDLVMELLPLAVRDDRTWSYTLRRQQELPTPVPPGAGRPTPGSAGLARRGGTDAGPGNPDEAR